MFRKSRIGLTAAAVAALVLGSSTAAQAADFHVWSSTGRSMVWYNDGGNYLVVCDMRDGDHVGAFAAVYQGHSYSNRTVYNGCEYFRDVPDGIRLEVSVFDRVYRNGTWTIDYMGHHVVASS